MEEQNKLAKHQAYEKIFMNNDWRDNKLRERFHNYYPTGENELFKNDVKYDYHLNILPIEILASEDKLWK